MDRLSPQTLGRVPDLVRRPGYDRDKRKIGIVHIGVGAFHRAHQAVYTDDAMSLRDEDWMISGVSLKSNSARQALEPQAGLYSVLENSGLGQNARIVGALKKFCSWKKTAILSKSACALPTFALFL